MSSPPPPPTKSASSPVAMSSPPAPPLTVSAPAAVSIVVVSVSVKTPPDSSMRTSSAPAPDRTEMSVKAARSKAEVPLGVTTCSDPAATRSVIWSAAPSPVTVSVPKLTLESTAACAA